jgi:hypothetical protein
MASLPLREDAHIASGVVAVDDSATVIVPAWVDRLEATVSVPADGDAVWLSRGGTPVAGEGICVHPGQTFIELVFKGEISGICAASESANVGVTEV